MAGLLKVLKKYREESFSERDKGERFERLMQAYLQTDPLYKSQLCHVWMWNEFPFKDSISLVDVGIDLVAQTFEGEYWAIQCKCYKIGTVIDKPEVDSFLTTSSQAFADDKGNKTFFSVRLWIDTTEKGFNKNAENAIKGQQIPVSRIGLKDLLEAELDWEELDRGKLGTIAQTKPKEPKEHQIEAIEAAEEYYKTNDRGKLIMACGTGKTFTSLKIAEKLTENQGLVLFMVPSIALLGQTLRAWNNDSVTGIRSICVCSDADVSRDKKQNEDADGYSIVDIAMPASTNPEDVRKQYFNIRKNFKGMLVVFSTYQSIECVSQAQRLIGDEFTFDLIVCDEAHRTTGFTLKDNEDSPFVKVHSNENIKARKRLYMTATPRLYSADQQSKAIEREAEIWSMDDVATYGKEFYRIGFGKAVEKHLLTDYKVLVLTLSESQLTPHIQQALAKVDKPETVEIETEDATRLIGCINALSKKTLLDNKLLKESDPEPMHRAVAFCQTIKISKKITDSFNACNTAYYETLTPEERSEIVSVESHHVDGGMSSAVRANELTWLKNAPDDGNKCRILTNVRCLSEGVDVPSLDAVLFLSARNSEIDVVQSVGRVMRVSEGKKYGYIIIPIIVPDDIKPEEALKDNKRYQVVWSVLNALRAHDDRFEATINKIDLNKHKPNNILVGGTSFGGDGMGSSEGGTSTDANFNEQLAHQLKLELEAYQGVIYAKMVEKVGNKRYWEQWASDVAKIAERHVKQINDLISTNEKANKAFEQYLKGLHKNINPSVPKDTAIEMLAQHIITQPVFEALFENYSFAQNNPISKAMAKIIAMINEHIDENDHESLERFYKSVRMRAEGIDNAEAKQKIIVELYDKFFKTAFPKTVEQLGIVYTPTEVVDFIIHSVEHVLNKEFDRSLTDENVNILDPFTGTGTFITRLLQSGIIKPEDLERKYTKEIKANEIVLLAYYIASINIENAYHDLAEKQEYQAFNG
ncbi:MAG: DEAD/DEAH box helicase, partial [Bacteroidales bacterium]|nr:DEAD/DEAH box helicase [Bacteroidales bacterium]